MNSTTAPSASRSIRRVDTLLAHYGQSHQNPKNELIHFIAIPLIMLSLLVMLLWAGLTFALLFAMGDLVLPLSVVLFVGAWILQFIGHHIEGKKPSFLEDIQYLWIGPLFVLSKLFGRLGLRW